MYIVTVGLIIVWLVIVPMALGYLMSRVFEKKFTDYCCAFGFQYIVGQLVMWGCFQILAVPVILAKGKLSLVMILWGMSIAAIFAITIGLIVRRKLPRILKIEKYKSEIKAKLGLLLAVLAVAVIVGYQCYQYIFCMHLDEDDARFVVNAVDAYERGTLFLTNPANGNYVGTWVGEMVKDVSSPWAIYLAMISKLIGIYPTIFAHTVYPAFLLVMGYVAFYLIGNTMFYGEVTKSWLMVLIAAVVHMSFGTSLYNQSVFTLNRIWQGKATVAGVMIPFLLYLLLQLYYDKQDKGSYVLLFFAGLSMCLMSGMGIFFSGIMIGVYGVWFTLLNKRWKHILYIAIACMPTVVYGLSYVLIK